MAIEIDLSGRVAMVTGGGGGIGEGIAAWLRRAGAAVAVNDIDAERAHDVARRLDALPVPGDVRVAADVDRIVATVGDTLGPIDIAVNNVGMTAGRPRGAFVDTPLDDAFAVIETNLVATYQCCRAEVRHMIERDRPGVIVNVSSGEATRPALGLAAYGAAKAAINHLTTTLATELGPAGIRVNAVAPGTTLTETVRRSLDDEQLERIRGSVPLRRLGDVDELGRLVVFLASDLARLVTGQVLLADAGAHLQRAPL